MSIPEYDVVFSCNKDTHPKALELAGLAQFRGVRPYVWTVETRGDPNWLEKFKQACASATLVSLHKTLPTVDSILRTSHSQFIELAKSSPLRTLVATAKGGAVNRAVKSFFGDQASFCSFHELWKKVIEMQKPPGSTTRGFGYAIIGNGDANLLRALVSQSTEVDGAGNRLRGFAEIRRLTQYPFDASEALMGFVASNKPFEDYFPKNCLGGFQSDFVLVYCLPSLRRMQCDRRTRAWALRGLLTEEAGLDRQRLFDASLLEAKAYSSFLKKSSLALMISERFGASPHDAFKPHRLPSCGTWDELSSRLSQYLPNPPGAAVGYSVELLK